MVTTGGTSLKDDIMRLYNPVHLLVGTPGRILDLAKKGICVLKDCSMLIMDEVCITYLNTLQSARLQALPSSVLPQAIAYINKLLYFGFLDEFTYFPSLDVIELIPFGSFLF